MKKLQYILAVLLFSSSSAIAELKMGIEGGFTWADIRAEDTAQALANASGNTVTYEYDEATWMGRIFADYAMTTDVHVEVGYFFTGSLDATYTMSGAKATEGYDAMGIDAAVAFHSGSGFFKAGMHSSELNGNGSITIGGTKYTVSETISGTGFLVGGGLQDDGARYGITYYSDMGGSATSDMTFLYMGAVF